MQEDTAYVGNCCNTIVHNDLVITNRNQIRKILLDRKLNWDELKTSYRKIVITTYYVAEPYLIIPFDEIESFLDGGEHIIRSKSLIEI
jgi:hypothetical protein